MCRKVRRPSTGRRPASAYGDLIVPVLTKIPVKSSVAMTGEITLRGRVLPDRAAEGEIVGRPCAVA